MKKKRIVAAAVIVRDGKVLIAQRPEGKALAGLWEFPGGKQEEGETIEECLKRELMEELGVEAEVGDFIMEVAHDYPDGLFIIKVFFTSIAEDAKIEMIVHQDLKWVDVEDMSNYPYPAADVEIVEKIKEIIG